MRRKKILSFILVMAMTMSLLISSAAAATATIGTTTHQYTSSEPIYFKVQADVVYSQLNSSQMTITAMQSRIWNYSSSAGSLVRPVFKADTGTITHSTAFTGVYDLIEIPAGTSNYYTNCDWANLASRLGGSNTYPVPSTPSVTNKSLETLIGVYGDSFDDNNVIGGTFIFDVPVDYVCPNTFDLLLQGELVNVEGLMLKYLSIN